MLRTLYSRLALTLFILFLLVGSLLVYMVARTSTQYQQEVSQKLNRDLASYIVNQHPLFNDLQKPVMQNGQVNQKALDSLFHQMMVINPAIEVYLLDPQGKIVSYNAPEGVVKRQRVDLAPITSYIKGEVRFPFTGEDPRNPDGHKVFTVAPIESNGEKQGYLYIVLGGEHYEHVAEMLAQSYIAESAMLVISIALTIAFFGGLLIFAHLTGRLKRLGNIMQHYASSEDAHESIRYTANGNDEIDTLGQQFNAMADRISEQFKALQKMDNARREMVANISHDLRTPLTTMRGYLETLSLHHNELEDSEKRQYIETALSHSQSLGNMIEELFELARLDSCESVVVAEPFSICELAQDVAQKYQLRAQEKNITLEVKLNPNTPLVYGDIGMMQRVLENLLENGLRNTPVGGRVSIHIDDKSGNTCVRIADTGYGIPAADMPRIFERFYQTDKHRSGGSGLGLAIVKRILELHGSAIQVKSEIEKGTEFLFSIPVKPI
jgi:two-component system, OmpR family, sensor kinase